jgi:uncharacterized protein (DUF697 family)
MVSASSGCGKRRAPPPGHENARRLPVARQRRQFTEFCVADDVLLRAPFDRPERLTCRGPMLSSTFMTSCKEEALRWVHRTAAGGAAFAAVPIPLSTSAGLAAMETTMSAMIGDIYGEPMNAITSTLTTGAMSVIGQGLKWLAMQGTLFVPVLGIPIRMGIAAATIEAVGHAVIAHYERKYPGKMFQKKQPPP